MLAHAGTERRATSPLGNHLMLNRTLLGSKCVAANFGLSCLRYCVFMARGVTQKVFVKCHKCEVGLCIKNTYFGNYHTKAQF